MEKHIKSRNYICYEKSFTRNQIYGFSIVELMITSVISLIVMAALISLFTNFSTMNRAQKGLANIQENGRFIASKMRKDIENVGFQPCATVSMDSPQLIDKGFAKRPIINYSNSIFGLPTGSIDPQYFVQGHECDENGSCSPNLRLYPGGDPSSLIPEAGNTEGKRAYKTDVITLRYLSLEPAYVDDIGATSTSKQFSLSSDPNSAPLSFENGNKILVSNCQKSFILNAQVISANRLEISSTDANVDWASKASFTTVYNFTKQFKTITYYVAFKQNSEDENRLTSTLYRIENGNEPQEIIEGVERFDITYGVQFVNGTMAYLTADQVQNAPPSTCTIEPIIPNDLGLPRLNNGNGCLWRSVFAIKLNVLLNTINNSSTSNTETFVYSPDGQTEQLPENIPSGINPGYMYRKEFTETISLKSNNL